MALCKPPATISRSGRSHLTDMGDPRTVGLCTCEQSGGGGNTNPGGRMAPGCRGVPINPISALGELFQGRLSEARPHRARFASHRSLFAVQHRADPGLQEEQPKDFECWYLQRGGPKSTVSRAFSCSFCRWLRSVIFRTLPIMVALFTASL